MPQIPEVQLQSTALSSVKKRRNLKKIISVNVNRRKNCIVKLDIKHVIKILYIRRNRNKIIEMKDEVRRKKN